MSTNVASMSDAAARVFNMGAKPAAAVQPGARTTRGASTDADFVQAEYYLNPGMGVMLPNDDGEEPTLGFVPLPKGLAFDTMELNDGRTDLFRARNDLLTFIKSQTWFSDMKPGDSMFLTPLVAGQMALQLLRRKDPNAAPVGPSPIASAIAKLFVPPAQ